MKYFLPWLIIGLLILSMPVALAFQLIKACNGARGP